MFIIASILAAPPSLAVQINGVPVAQRQPAFFASAGQDVLIEVPGAVPEEVRWFLLVPQALDYNNPAYCRHEKECAQPIEYRTREILSLRAKTRFPASSVPELASLGTHEIMVRAGTFEERFQLVIRRDDSYIGYATELLGVPFVYAPAYLSDGHQTDLRKGADCVALILYGRRRQGHRIPYTAPPKLYEFAEKIGDKGTIARTMLREGDILHFGFQTALVAEVRSSKPGLDDNALILHTYHGRAELTPFSKLLYKEAYFDVLRWRD